MLQDRCENFGEDTHHTLQSLELLLFAAKNILWFPDKELAFEPKYVQSENSKSAKIYFFR